MGLRGPLRKVGSVRWNRELRKNQRLAIVSGAATPNPQAVEKTDDAGLNEGPVCPANLRGAAAERWIRLARDMAEAGIDLKGIDSRAITVVAGYEGDLEALDALCSDESAGELARVAAIKARAALRKDYLAALVLVGGTSMARARKGITSAPRRSLDDDPWASM